MRIALIDGIQRAPEQAVVSVYDRGFLYGDSVFETIRTYGGAPYALGEHLARLARSVERVAMVLPVPLEALAQEVHRGLSAAQNPESYVRLMISRGVGPMGLDPDLAQAPSRFVLVEPLVA